jgi:hypothetical protein
MNLAVMNVARLDLHLDHLQRMCLLWIVRNVIL